IDSAVKLTGEIACKTNLDVTVLDVLPEAAPLYENLIEREENVERLLQSNSALGRNLRSVKRALEAAGLTVTTKLRHGLVVEEILSEIEEGNYDMVVTGSALATGRIRTYVMGDVTSEIVNRAQCAVLVVRGGPVRTQRGIFGRIA